MRLFPLALIIAFDLIPANTSLTFYSVFSALKTLCIKLGVLAVKLYLFYLSILKEIYDQLILLNASLK